MLGFVFFYPSTMNKLKPEVTSIWNLTVKQAVGKKYQVIQAVTFSSPSWGSPTTFDFGSLDRKGRAFTISKRSQRIARSM